MQQVTDIARRFRSLKVEVPSQENLLALESARKQHSENPEPTAIDELQSSFYGLVIAGPDPVKLAKAADDMLLKVAAFADIYRAPIHTVVYYSKNRENPETEMRRLRDDIDHIRGILKDRERQIIVLQKKLEDAPAVRLNEALVDRVKELEPMLDIIARLTQAEETARNAYNDASDQIAELETRIAEARLAGAADEATKNATLIEKLGTELTDERRRRAADCEDWKQSTDKLIAEVARHNEAVDRLQGLLKVAEKNRVEGFAELLGRENALKEELTLERETKPTAELEGRIRQLEFKLRETEDRLGELSVLRLDDSKIIGDLRFSNKELEDTVVGLKNQQAATPMSVVAIPVPCGHCGKAGELALQEFRETMTPTVRKIGKWLIAVQNKIDPEDPLHGTLAQCMTQIEDLVAYDHAAISN